MKVEHFVLCNEARNNNGRFYPMGIFNRLVSERLPAIIRGKSVALRMSFTPDQDLEGVRYIVISLMDADGKEVDKITDVLNLKYDSYPGFFADLCYEMKGVGLPKFGDYALNLSVNSARHASIPLSLVQKPQLAISVPKTKMHYYVYDIKIQDSRGGFPGFLSKSPPSPVVDGVMYAIIRDETKTSEEIIRIKSVQSRYEILRQKISRTFTAEEFQQLSQRHKEALQKSDYIIQAIPNFSAHIKPFSD